MSKISVAVITKNTLMCIGVKHILDEFFDIAPCIFNFWDNAIANEQDNFDLYIIDTEYFALNIDFFIPRRNKTLVFGNIENNAKAKTEVVSAYDDADSIIDRIKTIIEQIKLNNNTSHNELSQREIDVLKLVAEGCINKEIADRLNISINTVLTHRKNITAKLGIRSVSGLSFYAMMNGYVNSNL